MAQSDTVVGENAIKVLADGIGMESEKVRSVLDKNEDADEIARSILDDGVTSEKLDRLQGEVQLTILGES